MSRIRIVRNSAGNCINFVGTDNPTYWNACLRGEVNADDANRVNVVNTVQSYGSDTAYAFYAIPYYRFCDADGNDFANAQECADYITAQANVSGATAGYELTDQDQLGFRRDPTDTTIIISDGEYYPVNILLAEDAGDGTITIREQGDNGNILYTGLRPANASINGVAVNPVLADAVNELNALFNVESIVTPGVTTIINNYYYLGDDTIDPFGPGNERNPPMFTVPDLDSDGNDNNNGFTTNATGDYFIWAGPASNDPNDPYNKGNYLVGIVPADQDVTDFDTHTDLTQDLTWWVEVTDQGYTQNAGTILNPDTLTSGVAYGSGSSVATQFRIGRSTDNRLIVEGTTVPWGTTPIETDWFEVIRTNTTVAAGSKWRLVWKAMSDGACINTNTIIAVDGENSLTYYYIESPDTVFYYPIFTTASEAAYYSANPDLGAGDGTYTAVTFDDVPGNIVYYIPNNGSTIDGTFPTTQGPLHPNTGNGYDANGTYWTEIPTEADNLYVPIAFNGSDYIFNEGDGVNIVIQTDGAYTTTVTGLPSGLTYENGNITGSAPEVSGTTLDNQYDTFTVTVTRTNSYGSSTGTFVIQVNNQTAAPTAITGWTWDPDTEQLIDEETLDEGSVVCIDNPLSEDYRMIFSRTWINTNVLPYLQEAGDAIYIGVVRSGMSITDYTDPANVDDLDWEAYISFEYVSPTSHRSTLYGYHNGAPEKDQVLSASLTATTYDFAFENDDHGDLYVLAANVKSLNNEPGLDYSGSVARSVETFADGDLEVCMATVGCNATIENTGVDIIRIPLGDNFIRINEPTENPETYTFDTATATGLPDMPTLQAGQTYTFFMGSNDLTGLDSDDILCFTLDGTTEYTAVARAAIVGTEVNPVITGGNQNILINGRNITLLDTGPSATIDDLIQQINLALEIGPAINVIASNNGTGQLRLRATDDTTNIAVANNGGTGLEQLGITATTVTPTSGLIRNGVPGEAGTTVTFVVPIDVPVPLYWHIGSKNDMNITTVEEVIVTGSIWPDDLVTDPADSSTPVVDPNPDNLFPDPVTGLTAGGGLQNGTAIELGLLQRGQRMVFSHDFIRHLTEHMPLYETGGTDVLRDKNRIYIGIIADQAYETNIYGTGAMLETRLGTPRYPDADATGWGTENAGMGSAIFGNSAMWFEKSTYNYADHSQTANYDPLTQGTHQARGFFTTAMNLGRISADPGTEDIYDEWAYAIEFSPESGDDNLYYLADPDENLLYTLPGDHTNHQEWSMYDEQRMADVLGGGSTSSTQLSVPADWRRYFSQTEEDNGNDPWLVADPSTTPATYGYRVVLIAEGPDGSFAKDIELDLNGVDIIPIPVENPITQTSTHAWDGKGSNYWVKDNSPYAQGGITLAEHASNVFYDASTSTTTPSAPNSAGATSPDGYPWAFASVFQMDVPTPTTKQTLFTVGGDPIQEHGVFSIMFDGHYLQLLMGAGNEIYISEKPDFYFRHGDWYGLYIDYNGEHIMSGVNTSFRIHNVNLSTGNSHSIELDFNEFRKATWDDIPNNRPSGDISTNITYTSQGLEGNQCVGVYPVQTLSTDSMTRTNYWLGNIAQITQTTLPVNSVLPTDHEIALMTRDPMTWIAEYKETGSLNNSAGTYRLPANNTNSTGFASGTGADGYQGVQVYRFGDGLPDGETFSSYQIPNEIYSNQENTPTRLGGNGNTTGCIINVTIPGITVDPGGDGGDGGGGDGGSGVPCFTSLGANQIALDGYTNSLPSWAEPNESLAPQGTNFFEGNSYGWASSCKTIGVGQRIILSDVFLADLLSAMPDYTRIQFGIRSNNWSDFHAFNPGSSNGVSNPNYRGFVGNMRLTVSRSTNTNMSIRIEQSNDYRSKTESFAYNVGDRGLFIDIYDENTVRVGLRRDSTSGDLNTTAWEDWNKDAKLEYTPTGDVTIDGGINAYGYDGGTGHWPMGSNEELVFVGGMTNPQYANGALNAADVDWTAISVIPIPSPALLELTNWDNAIEFDGVDDYIQQVSEDVGEGSPLAYGGTTTASGPNSTSGVGKTSASMDARPWAMSVVFQPGSLFTDVRRDFLRQGSQSGNHVAVYQINSNLYFTAGGDTSCLIANNLSTDHWYGLYVATNGYRTNSGSPESAFEIYLMSSSNNWAAPVADLSTTANWSGTSNWAGAINGKFYLGSFSTGSYWQGKIASCVTTTLLANVHMPSLVEVERMIVDPMGWVCDYKVGRQFRQPDEPGTENWIPTRDSDFDLNSGAEANATQIWLMGDGTGDAYTDILNQVRTSDANTVLRMYNMDAGDIIDISNENLIYGTPSPVSSFEQKGPSSNQTGDNLFDTGDYGWACVSDISADQRMVMDGVFLADVVSAMPDDSVISIGVKDSAWTNSYSSSNFEGGSYFQIRRLNGSDVQVQVRASGDSTTTVNTTAGALSGFGAFIEVSADGNNIRLGFTYDGDGSTDNEITTPWADWGTTRKRETGDQSYGITTRDIVIFGYATSGNAAGMSLANVDWTGLEFVSTPV